MRRILSFLFMFMIFLSLCYAETAKIEIKEKMTDEQLMQKAKFISEAQQKPEQFSNSQPSNKIEPTYYNETISNYNETISKLELMYNKRINNIGDLNSEKKLDYYNSEKKLDYYKKQISRSYVLTNQFRYDNESKQYDYKYDSLIKQFGYDFFKKDVKTDYLLPISESYKLGPGDTISFYLWGDPVEILGLNGFYSLEVDRTGKVFVPNLGAVYLWGMSVSEAKDIFRKLLSKKFKRFEIELTLGKIRNFPVYVTGEVEKQGIVFANGTNSVLDVLTLAGGVKKTGTLRDIVLKRNENGKIVEHHIDLYSILIFGEPVSLVLKEGDSIYVKNIGKTVSVVGAVKREGIFELKENENFNDVIKFVGGILPSANAEIVRVFSMDKNKQNILSYNIKQLEKIQLIDGDIINFEELNFIVENNISVTGTVKYPGSYSYDVFKKLSEIVKKVEFLPDTNLFYGQINRKDLIGGKDIIINFVPIDVLNGKEDFELKPFDKITFYNKVVYSPIEISGEIEKGMIIPYYDKITLLDVVRGISFKYPVRELKLEVYSDNDTMKTVYLYELLNKADKNTNLQLTQGTKILVKKLEPTEKDKTITILGEVMQPGVYKYKSGMTLYDIIKQAGGYTEDAYPKSLIFIRESAKRLQYEQLQLTLISMEESIAKNTEAFKTAAGSSEEEKALLQMTLDKQKKLLDIIRKKAEIGLGRVALDIPDELEDLKKSNQNIELQDGDYIYIPSKPNYVLVLGSVYNQISLPHSKNKTVRDYIEDVGGTSKDADEKDIYIIKANGKVVSYRNFKSSFLGGGFYEQRVDQGDTIVIPQDLKIPTLWRPLIKDVTQIIFQALSTAVLAKRL